MGSGGRCLPHGMGACLAQLLSLASPCPPLPPPPPQCRRKMRGCFSDAAEIVRILFPWQREDSVEEKGDVNWIIRSREDVEGLAGQ